jgi:hypothetical protein
MATLIKTWTHDVNNVIGAGLTQVQQYQELFFALHSAFVAAGYTVVASSDGVSASAGDNIGSSGDVVVGSSAAARTWALYEFGALQHKGQILIEAEDTATTTPQDIRYTFSSLDFDISSISASAAPVEPSLATYFQTDSVILRDWTTPVDGVWHSIVSDRGDVIFFAKRQSQAFNEFEFWLRVDDPVEAGVGTGEDHLCVFRIHNPSNFAGSGLGAGSSISSDCGAYMNLSDEIAIRIAVGGPGGWASSSGPNNTAWANGLDFAGRLLVFDLEFYSSTSPFRWMGKWVDIKAVSNNTPGGTVEDGDGEPLRYAVVAAGVMIPWPSGEFPIL